MRSTLEWAQVRTLAAEGLSQREIARRLGINRRTVIRLVRSDEPPHYRRPALGSQLDPFEPVLRRLVEEWPQIKAPRATEILRECGPFCRSERNSRPQERAQRPARSQRDSLLGPKWCTFRLPLTPPYKSESRARTRAASLPSPARLRTRDRCF